MRSILTKISERSSLALLLVLGLVSAVTMYLLFNPSSPWFSIVDAISIAPPETAPGFAVEPVFQFLSGLNVDQQAIYLRMHEFDALYYFALGAALLALFGLVLKRFAWSHTPLIWVLMVPIMLVAFESLESIALLSIMYLAPTRIEPLLWVAEIATAGKTLSYLVALVFFGLAILMLPISAFVKRS